jgi:hypothetical protein
MLSGTAQEGDSKVDVEVTGGSIEGRKKCVAIVCPFVGRCIIICDIIVLLLPSCVASPPLWLSPPRPETFAQGRRHVPRGAPSLRSG